MSKKVLLSVCVLSITMLATPHEATAETDWEALQRCTVKILGVQEVGMLKIDKNEGKWISFAVPLVGHGSGVIWQVGDNGTYIVTNRHVVENTFALAVGVQGIDELFPARVLHESSTQDLAVIAIDTSIPASVCDPTYQKSEAKLGGDVRVFGYALDATAGEAKMSAGIISRTEGDLVEVDAAMNPGNSGGPAFNKQGDIIGVSVSGIAGAEGMNFIIPVSKIDGLILAIQNHELKKWKTILGTPYWDVYQAVSQALRHVSLQSYSPEELLSKTLGDDFIEAAESIVEWVEDGKQDLTVYEVPQFIVLAASITFNTASVDMLEAKVVDSDKAKKLAMEKLKLSQNMLAKGLELDGDLAKWQFAKHLIALHKASGGTLNPKSKPKPKSGKKTSPKTYKPTYSPGVAATDSGTSGGKYQMGMEYMTLKEVENYLSSFSASAANADKAIQFRKASVGLAIGGLLSLGVGLGIGAGLGARAVKRDEFGGSLLVPMLVPTMVGLGVSLCFTIPAAVLSAKRRKYVLRAVDDYNDTDPARPIVVRTVIISVAPWFVGDGGGLSFVSLF